MLRLNFIIPENFLVPHLCNLQFTANCSLFTSDPLFSKQQCAYIDTDMIFQLMITITGVFGGPSFGLFTMGMFLPFINRRGAFVGYLFGAGLYVSYLPPAPLTHH